MAVISRPQQMLRDYCRFNGYTGPIYFLINEEKIQLHKYYTVKLSIDDNIVAEGVGLSRRIAEFKAALNAINTISQNDPTILEFQQKKQNKYKNTRRPINRSFSEDYLSKNSRSCSIQSFGSAAAATIEGDPSTTPSIDGIDSAKSDYSTNASISTNNNINNNNADDPKRKDAETSSDEGVDVECSESSSSALPSPKLESEEQLLSADYSKSSLKRTDSKSKFFQLFSSFPTFRRQSLRKSSSSLSTSSVESGKIPQNKTNGKFLIEDSSRPNSSSSASSTSSAFSSDSSITSSTANNLINGNHGDNNHHQDISLKHTSEESTLINNLSNGITEAIPEEDELDNDDNDKNDNNDNVDKTEQKQKNLNKIILHRNATSLGSYSSYNIHQQQCSHSHFSMCTPSLCNGLSSSNNLSLHPIESCLTLLKYCVRMYLPLPFYDLKYQQNHFQVTCRVIINISKSSKNNNEKLLPVIIPDKYLNKQFTAKGNGDVLRIARNMAAERIIEKLKEANIYYEEERKFGIPPIV